MTGTFLITRPEHDDTTHYLSKWSAKSIGLAESKGMTILDLEGPRANRKDVESMIAKCCPRLIVFNGHGDDAVIFGHDDEPILIAGENENLLDSKIVYAISCRSAKGLGPSSIEAGAISYNGYDDDFIFVFEPEKMSRPLQDETARLFLEPSQVFVSAIIKGNTVKESKERAESLMKENMLRLLGENEPQMAMVRYLWWDLKHFKSLGNLDATV